MPVWFQSKTTPTKLDVHRLLLKSFSRTAGDRGDFYSLYNSYLSSKALAYWPGVFFLPCFSFPLLSISIVVISDLAKVAKVKGDAKAEARAEARGTLCSHRCHLLVTGRTDHYPR